MKPVSVIESTEAYLNVHLTRSGPPGATTPVGPFVTLSRESGVGGWALAQTLASRLHDLTQVRWEVYSGNLIDEMLRTNQLPPSLAARLPEDRISLVDASVGEILGLHPDLWELVRKTNDLLVHLARAGHVILLGRGANFATAGIAHGLHVRLVADPAFRATTTAHRLAIDLDAARWQNDHRDAARRRYVRAHFDADITAPTAYDLVLNIAQISRDLAVDTIARLVQARTTGIARATIHNLATPHLASATTG